MSTREVVLAAVRLCAVFIVLRLIFFFIYWGTWLSFDEYRPPVFWLVLIVSLFWSTVALLLIKHPNRLMAWLSPETLPVATDEDRQIRMLEIVGIRLIGFFFFAQAAIELLEYVLYFSVRYTDYLHWYRVVVRPLPTDQVAGIAHISAMSVLSIWLMMGPSLVQKFIEKLRTAGREWMDRPKT